MKPETSMSNLIPEQPSVRRNDIERKLELPDIESSIKEGAERYEQRSENSAVVSDISMPVMLPAPVIDGHIIDNSTTFSDSPLIAGDDDLIEKEWIDRAKKIVADTRDNPHGRDEAVNKLQIDYKKKRYGRKLGDSQ